MSPTLDELNQSPGLNKLVRARDGLFLANVNDTYIGRALLQYGEYNQREAETLNQLVAEHDVVIEVGANIGAHTVGIAKKIGSRGRVIAYEPQPVLFQNLCANIALNSLLNTDCRQAAVGARPGSICVPFIRYELEGNFGGLALGSFTEGLEIPLVTIDEDFKLGGLKLIKIDVEGMESQVIAGATAVIGKFRPILYVENDRVDRSAQLIEQIKSLGYRLWWDLPPLFNPRNFAGNPINIFGNVVSINMLCAHRSINATIDRPEIIDNAEHPLRGRQPGQAT